MLTNFLRSISRLPVLLLIVVLSSLPMVAFQRRSPSPSISVQQVVQPPGEGFFKEPVAIPDFPEGLDWINTNSKLRLSDLKGKLVLLDFWTYCCINCMHILPVLDEVEKKYEKDRWSSSVSTRQSLRPRKILTTSARPSNVTRSGIQSSTTQIICCGTSCELVRGQL